MERGGTGGAEWLQLAVLESGQSEADAPLQHPLLTGERKPPASHITSKTRQRCRYAQYVPAALGHLDPLILMGLARPTVESRQLHREFHSVTVPSQPGGCFSRVPVPLLVLDLVVLVFFILWCCACACSCSLLGDSGSYPS